MKRAKLRQLIKEEAKTLINEATVKDFEKWINTAVKENPSKVRQAVEWMAGSVHGDTLPQQLHRDDVTLKHIKKVISKIKRSMKNWDERGLELMLAFVSRADTKSAEKLLKSIEETLKDEHGWSQSDISKLKKKKLESTVAKHKLAEIGNPNLLGSSPTLDGIRNLISQYLMGSTITLDKISDRPETYSVSTKKGKSNNYKVVKKGKRYRFEEI